MTAEHTRIPNDTHTSFVLTYRRSLDRTDPLALYKIRRRAVAKLRLQRMKRRGS